MEEASCGKQGGDWAECGEKERRRREKEGSSGKAKGVGGQGHKCLAILCPPRHVSYELGVGME